MEPTLLAAYSITDYCVDSDAGRFKLHCGDYSPQLDELQKSKGVECSAFITAWNPRSKPTSALENEAAHEALYADICALGLECISGIGEAPSGKWAGERSFLVLGLSKDDCINLGKKYGQNAVLFADSKAVPFLVFPVFDECSS
jgi:hypothetical protein